MVKTSIQYLVMFVMVIGIQFTAMAAGPGRVTVQGTQFHLDGNQVYMNGANTPWNSWNDFGGLGGGTYDRNWWEAEFVRMKAKGINSTRVWISCSGETQPFIDANGYITGVSQQFWNDLDHYMGLASKYQIYVMASMMSFDHVKDSYTTHLRWRAMFSTQDRVQAMIDNYIVPFVVRYKDNPYLYAIDLCNEPEWMNENADSGYMPISQIQRYAAMSAAAIHKSGSEVLVTIGSACVKWNSDSYDGNNWSDSALQAHYADAEARLDFYQIHYYLWMEPWFPLLRSPADHGLNDRPLVMGEMPARDDASVFPAGLTMAQAFESFFSTGYSGHYPWTTNGVDYQGDLDSFGAAALTLQQAHSDVRSGPTGYLVVYNNNESTGGAVPAAQDKAQNSTITLASNTGGLGLSGYNFGGWNTEMDGSGTTYAAGAVYTGNASLTLYAKWTTGTPTYSVAYNANGATSGSTPSGQTKTQGISLTIATNSGNLAQAGYTFAGWNTAANGSGTNYAAGAIYSADADLTLYAKWTAVPTYTVTYSANGATSGSAPTDQTKIQGIALTLASNDGSLARTGYMFAEWNTAANGSGTDYTIGAIYTANANLTLYAKWTAVPTYAVTYTANSATSGSAPADQTKTQGIALTLASNSGSLARTGYTFAGWNTAASGTGTDYTIGAIYTANADLTLYAKWTAVPTYTVTYTANGATSGSAPANQSKIYDTPLILAINDGSLARSGYTFIGWNTEYNGSGIDYAVGAEYTANADISLYAKWLATASPVVIVSPITGNTTESGGSATFTVMLSHEPANGVIVPIASNDLSEATLSVDSIYFSISDWDSPQTVTVTGVDDSVADGNVGYTVIIGSTVSSDANFDGLNPADIAMINEDDDSPIIVTGLVSSYTTESGGTTLFTVALAVEPSANVVISVTSSDVTEGNVSHSSLSFTAANWSTPQTVTVTGVNDDLDDGDIDYNVIIGPAISTDATFNGLNPADLAMTNEDDEISRIVTNSISTNTTEAGGTATSTIVLSAEPTGNVVISVSSSDATEGSLSLTSLIFTPANWDSPQTVTVTGVNDDLDDGNIEYTIIIGAAVSSDANFNGLDSADLTMINEDDDIVNTPSMGSSSSSSSGGGCSVNGNSDVYGTWIPLAIVLFSLLTFAPGRVFRRKSKKQ